MHTARYEEHYPLQGKRVAVIGAGSSGVQCVAKIQKEVQHLYHWVRSPIWITAGFAQTWAGHEWINFAYTPEQRQYLEDNPRKYLEYRKQVENELNQRFKFIIKGSDAPTQARQLSYEQMVRKLNGDLRLCNKIIPTNFNPGCRHPTPASGYLEALVAENATIFTEDISEITETGFKDQEGKEYEVDVIICATGFDTTRRPRFPFIGKTGRDLRSIWDPAGEEGVLSYLSIGVPEFPNYFTFGGPFGPLGHGSFMPLIEAWTSYMFAAIRKAQVENVKAMTPRKGAAMQFRQHADHFLKRTAWTSPCKSWFKQGREDGQLTMWPGSRLHHLELLRAPRWEDFELEWYAFVIKSFCFFYGETLLTLFLG